MFRRRRALVASSLFAALVALGCQTGTTQAPAKAPRAIVNFGAATLDAEADLAVKMTRSDCKDGTFGLKQADPGPDPRVAYLVIKVTGPGLVVPYEEKIVRDQFTGCFAVFNLAGLAPGTYQVAFTSYDAQDKPVAFANGEAQVAEGATATLDLKCNFATGGIKVNIDCCDASASPTPEPSPTPFVCGDGTTPPRPTPLPFGTSTVSTVAGGYFGPGSMVSDGAGGFYLGWGSGGSGGIDHYSATDVKTTTSTFGGVGLARDAAGNLYYADLTGSIKKVNLAATPPQVTDWYTDLAGVTGGFYGLDIAADGKMYATTPSAVYRVNPRTPAEPGGSITLIAGDPAQKGHVDGPAANARFEGLVGIQVASDGTIFVTDAANNAIRQISPAGVVSTLAGTTKGCPGYGDGIGRDAWFWEPHYFDFDTNGDLIVADFGNEAVRRVTRAGIVTQIAGTGPSGSVDGDTSVATFHRPNGTFVGTNGVYVTSANDGLLRVIR